MSLSDILIMRSLFPSGSSSCDHSNTGYVTVAWYKEKSYEEKDGIYKISDLTPTLEELNRFFAMVDDQRFSNAIGVNLTVEDVDVALFINSDLYPEAGIAAVFYEEVDGASPGFWVIPPEGVSVMYFTWEPKGGA